MKSFLILLIFILFNSCASYKSVYWCGDHACINNKEKEAYFKKNQVVEKKVFGKKEKYVPNEEIIKKAVISEKNRIKNEKDILKQKKLDEKRKIKEEKKLLKELKKEEKKRIKKNKKFAKKAVLDKEIEPNVDKINIGSNLFTDLKNKIINRNKKKSYPDINKINE